MELKKKLGSFRFDRLYCLKITYRAMLFYVLYLPFYNRIIRIYLYSKCKFFHNKLYNLRADLHWTKRSIFIAHAHAFSFIISFKVMLASFCFVFRCSTGSYRNVPNTNMREVNF